MTDPLRTPGRIQPDEGAFHPLPTEVPQAQRRPTVSKDASTKVSRKYRGLPRPHRMVLLALLAGAATACIFFFVKNSDVVMAIVGNLLAFLFD